MIDIQNAHVVSRKYLELIQDVIVLGLCAMLFLAMGMKLFHLGQRMLTGTDFSLVVGDILFLLVLLELFRLLVIYLEEHRVSVSTMVGVGIVSTLREVILRGALHVLRAPGTKCVQSLQLDSAVPNRRRALRACLIWDIRPSTDTTT